MTPPKDQGTASDTHTVILDFPSGAFTLNKFSVQPPDWDPDHHAALVSNALASYFATNDIKYIVQTINYADLSKDPALQPTRFWLNQTITNNRNNILQMLIDTTSTVEHATTITLSEPIPYDPKNPVLNISDYTVSLMVSTELMFEHIFVSSFNKGGTNLKVEAVKPPQDFKTWSAKVTQGSAVGNANFQNPYDIQGRKTELRISASNNDITWDLTGMTFKPTETAGIWLHHQNGEHDKVPATGGTEIKFQYRQYVEGHSVPTGGGGTVWIPGYWPDEWKDSSAKAWITMDAYYPLEVTGEGRQQLVKFSTVEPKVIFQDNSAVQLPDPLPRRYHQAEIDGDLGGVGAGHAEELHETDHVHSHLRLRSGNPAVPRRPVDHDERGGCTG